jgi:flagellin
MTLSLVTNVAALGAQRNLDNTSRHLAANIGRLSSGLRINQAADDAAGLGISEKLKSEIRSTLQARRNAQDGISLTQTAEGALNEVTNIITRMRELGIQAANGTLGNTERDFIQTEFVQLRSEIDRIARVTEFNGMKLFSGEATSLVMQIGIREGANNTATVVISVLDLSTLGDGTVASGFNALHLSSAASAAAALAVFDEAIVDISTMRSRIGAFQNRLQITINNLSVSHENLSAANSRIRDVDVAEETSAFTRNQILTQAGVSVLAQANQIPAAALSLLG